MQGRPSSRGGLINANVSVIARDLRCSPAMISRKLAKGMTVAEIKAEVEKRNAIISAGGRVRGRVFGTEQERLLPPGAPRPEQPLKYVPKRVRAAKLREEQAGVESRGGSVEVPVSVPTVPTVPTAFTIDHPSQLAPVMEFGDNSISGETIARAQLRKEIALANNRELEYFQKRQLLVPVAHVNRWFGGVIIQARDALLRLPAELRDRIAAETDPIECERVIREKLVEVLKRLRTMDGAGVDLTGPMADENGEAA